MSFVCHRGSFLTWDLRGWLVPPYGAYDTLTFTFTFTFTATNKGQWRLCMIPHPKAGVNNIARWRRGSNQSHHGHHGAYRERENAANKNGSHPVLFCGPGSGWNTHGKRPQSDPPAIHTACTSHPHADKTKTWIVMSNAIQVVGSYYCKSFFFKAASESLGGMTTLLLLRRLKVSICFVFGDRHLRTHLE